MLHRLAQLALLFGLAACGGGSPAPLPPPDVPQSRDSQASPRDVAFEVWPDAPAGCASHAECDDANPCTLDICDIDGRCVHSPVAGSCDDGDACTTGDRCEAGRCMGEPVSCPEDEDTCTRAVCDSELGCTWACAELPGCVLECQRDDDCDDGDPGSLDTCVRRPCSSVCRHSWPACDDGNPCTLDYRADGGACAHAPLPGEPCDDGNACTVGDRCQQELCVGALVRCDDGNPCTSSYCDRHLGCQHPNRPDGMSCDDGDLCTEDGTCFQGRCLGQEVSCPDMDGDDHCGTPYCDPAWGCLVHCGQGIACQSECDSGLDCDDGEPCTLDACVSTACRRLCRHTPNPCDDGDPCTLDTCLPGLGCHHERLCEPCERDRDCDDGDACTIHRCGDDGLCRFLPVICPDDGDPCTQERCDPQYGCTFVCQGCGGGAGLCSGPDDPDCDDGDPCTVDACVEGPCGRVCRSEPVFCAKASFCDEPLCFEGRCLHTLRAASPTIDGLVGEDWHPASALATDDRPCALPGAALRELRVQHDDEMLYVGVMGVAGPGQAIVGYLDVDMGVIDPREGDATGIRHTQHLRDHGPLDAAIAGGVAFLPHFFGADFAFGTVGMASAYGVADSAGWRQTPGDNSIRRVDAGAVLASVDEQSVEALIPLDLLWASGPAAEGAAVGLVVLLVDTDARCPAYALPSLPPQPDDWLDETPLEPAPDSPDPVFPPCATPQVTEIATFLVQPDILRCCETDDDCRDADPCTYDICTMGGLCTYVFGVCD